MSDKTVGLRDPKALRELQECLGQRSGVPVSANKAVELAVNVTLKGLGADSDSSIYSSVALTNVLRAKTFAATVGNLRAALHYFESDAFEVIADPETCSIEIRRVKDGVDRTLIMKGAHPAPIGVQ